MNFFTYGNFIKVNLNIISRTLVVKHFLTTYNLNLIVDYILKFDYYDLLIIVNYLELIIYFDICLVSILM